ncbi:Sensory transduction histidine kinase [Acidobacterium capsulatum ATCC 51196]|uniref:histidine kinase n=2 Tax=Acidobacteriaceae TaxID=204434 RepID=C1F6Z3_ACIC5|nr:Sensory transduction histidine kinase [Acidobacterium capsulatum ATCC 51196]
MSEEEYLWLAENGLERCARAGSILFRAGETADAMTILLQGEIQVHRDHSGPMAIFIGRAGQITGLLPFSRMKTYGGRGQATTDVWALQYPREMFDEMIRAVPSMVQRSVSVLVDRAREVTRLEQQAEKLAALGKLAANLAHELNNPASAAQRSAAGLLSELKVYGRHKFDLGSLCLDEARLKALHGWQRAIVERSQASKDEPWTVEEEQLLNWLQAHSIEDAWKICPDLCEARVTVADLEELDGLMGHTSLSIVLGQFASSRRTERMAQAMVDSTARIFDLIAAIKDYSYMDQAPIQDVDVPQSLETTLVMMQSRLGHTSIERNFQPGLPRISAYGSELNQVWTAVLENALEATHGEGCIRLNVKHEGEAVVVEIQDDGPGIAPEIQDRIFEPFFSTKAPGDGLGLGLDTVQRIVRRHRGFVTVTSEPGSTCFQVRLPIEPLQAY